MNRLQQLQQQIADDGARENIESFCFLETIEDGHHWYSEYPDDPENEIVAPSVEYLTLRGLIARHPDNDWVRVDVASPVEPAMDKQDAAAVEALEKAQEVKARLRGCNALCLNSDVDAIIAALKQSLAQPQPVIKDCLTTEIDNPQPQAPVLPNCYITTVPDHHDRIVWRNTYYHLPLDKAPVVPEGWKLVEHALLLLIEEHKYGAGMFPQVR